MNNTPYPAELQPLMQTLLATLADLDFAHERELERVATGSGSAEQKERARAKLETSHRERREPYVQQLGALEWRVCADMPDVSRSPHDRAA